MTYFLIYMLIVAELFFIGLYFLAHWLKYKRRFSDVIFFVLSFLLGISYLFFGLEYLNIGTKIIQTGIDLVISFFLGLFFIRSMNKEIRSKGR